MRVTYPPAKSGPRIAAVDDLSLDIRKQEVVGILGESGCGKSTLAAAILHLLPASARQESGSIFLGGIDLQNASESELRRLRGKQISWIPQDPASCLNPVIRVGSQIGEVLTAHLPLQTAERRARVVALLSEVGLAYPHEIYGAYPHQLSGGQRQRIAIAQAIACRPALVIADEPSSKLDAPLEAEIISLLARIRTHHGTALLMITHNPGLLVGFADRIAIMYAGRIVELGVTASIFRNPLHPYTQALVRLARSAADINVIQHLLTIEGESPDPSAFPIGCRFETRCPERMNICTQRYPETFSWDPATSVNCFKYGN